MTSRERIQALFSGRRPDRIPLRERYWEDTLESWKTQGYPLDTKGDPLDPVAHFGVDIWPVNPWFDNLPLIGQTKTLDESADWIIRQNGAGAVTRTWKRRNGAPEHLDFAMTSREVWERDYRAHLLTDRLERTNWEKTRQTREAYQAEGVSAYYGNTFLWDTMRQSMGDLTMMESLLLEPEWIRDYNEVYTDFYIRHYRLLFEKAGLPDSVWVFDDLGYKNGLFCSPKVLEELFFPYYKRFVDFIHSYGVPVVLHSCGRIHQALPLIVQAGFDGLNPMEAKAGCDVRAFAREYPQLCFFGGFDVRIFESGDRALIKREISALCGDMKALGTRYAFSSDHSISSEVCYADYLYALEIFHEIMDY